MQKCKEFAIIWVVKNRKVFREEILSCKFLKYDFRDLFISNTLKANKKVKTMKAIIRKFQEQEFGLTCKLNLTIVTND
jgi:hypothetical protein